MVLLFIFLESLLSRLVRYVFRVSLYLFTLKARGLQYNYLNNCITRVIEGLFSYHLLLLPFFEFFFQSFLQHVLKKLSFAVLRQRSRTQERRYTREGFFLVLNHHRTRHVLQQELVEWKDSFCESQVLPRRVVVLLRYSSKRMFEVSHDPRLGRETNLQTKSQRKGSLGKEMTRRGMKSVEVSCVDKKMGRKRVSLRFYVLLKNLWVKKSDRSFPMRSSVSIQPLPCVSKRFLRPKRRQRKHTLFCHKKSCCTSLLRSWSSS